MELLLKRIFKGPEYTIGHLYIDGKYFCDTLEDTDRGLLSSQSLQEIQSKKIYGKTAIPAGVYDIDLSVVSLKFEKRKWALFCEGKLPRLLNVKGFEGILIHVGNTISDTLGCILVGENKVKGKVINSTVCFKKLYQKIQDAYNSKQKVSITIV